MTAYDLPHCSVEEITSGGNTSYVIRSDNGWLIHLTKRNPNNYYKTCVMLTSGYDWASIEIVSEADLPPDANIAGVTNPPVTV